MASGTVLIGLSGYLFLVVVGRRAIGPAAAALASLYLATNILGPGLFVAIEQETSRLTSRALADGRGLTAIARRTAAAATVLAAVTLIVLAVTGPLLPQVLRNTGLVLALGLSVVGSAAVFWVRGLAAGQRRFHRYAVTLMVDAGVRILGCAGLALLDVDEPLAYALALSGGPLAAAILTVRGVVPAAGRPQPDPPPSRPTLARSVTTLLVSSGIAMTLANLAPVVVTAALPGTPALAFAFAAGLVLTRAPLLLIAPVQAVLLPRFTGADARGDLARFRRELRRGLLAVAAVAGLGAAGWGLLGRSAMRIVYGAGADLLPTATLMLLAVGAGLLMTISLVQPALVALGSPAGMALGWVCGAAAFGLSFLLPLDPIDRAVAAQLAGPAVTLLVQAQILRHRIR